MRVKTTMPLINEAKTVIIVMVTTVKVPLRLIPRL